MNDIPSVASLRRWAEGVATNIDQVAVSTPITFVVSPSSIYYKRAGTGGDGWIDARGHEKLNVLVTATTQNCNFSIEVLRTSDDPSPQTLVASTAVSAGNTVQLYAGSLDYIAFFRINQAGTAGGTVNVSFLMK